MIDVVLHVANVVFNKKRQCDGGRADNASALHSVFGDTPDQVREQQVVTMPEFDDVRPRQILITVGLDPLVLGITRAFVGAFGRSHYKAHMVVGSGIDQVTKFLFWRP